MRHFTLLLIGGLGCHSSSPISFDGRETDGAGGTDSSAIDSSMTDAPVGDYTVARSGSRLKLSWWQTSDGTRSPSSVVFYDSLLQQSCRPTMWTDAAFLCTPSSTSATGSYEYTDAACTMPLLTGGPFPAGTYFSVVTQPAALCGGVLIDHMVAPGAQVPSPPSLYYLDGTMTCIHTSAGPSKYYQVVPVPESTFVPVTTNYDATGAIQQMHWDSPDGMRWYRPSGKDTALDAACSFQPESSTVETCDPRGQMVTAYFDSTCAMPLITDPIGCTPPAYARPLSLCSTPDHSILTVGAQTSPNPAYDASCSPGNPDIHSSYYSVAPTSIGNVQTMTRSPLMTDPHRLKPIFFDATGLHYETGYFFDSMLNMECAFGGTSCGPVGTLTTKVLYTDSSCTNAFDAIEVDDDPPSCNTTPGPPPSYGIKVLGVGMREFHRITTQHTGVVYENTGECRRYPETGIPQSWRIFEVDPTVTPPTAFEAAAVVIDP